MQWKQPIQIAHFNPHMGIGGTARVILDLCRFGSIDGINQFVVSLHGGPFVAEAEKVGSAVYVEKNLAGFRRRLAEADLVNIHLAKYQKWMYLPVWTMNIPHVVTLHWLSVLPDLPCPIICTSEAAKVIQKNSSKCVTISNGVDLQRFSRKKRHKDKKDKIILTRICRPEKCDEYFWQAMEEVLRREPSVELWIVGEHNTSSDQIKFFGMRSDIENILSQSDIFVYTPRPGEGSQDLVVREAMAAGVPCVLSDVECVRESVCNGHDGILVHFGRVKDFADAVIMLIRNPAIREHLGKNALQKARSDFNILDKVHQYADVYRHVMKEYSSTQHHARFFED